MRAERNKILVITGGIIALIVVAAIVAVLFFDINSYKKQIETATSGATGLDVKIKGRMGLSFFPFGVSAKDVHAAGKRGEILSIEYLKLGVELMPLLKKQLKVTSCVLVKPVVFVEKDVEGRFNFESDENKSIQGKSGTVFSLNDLTLSKGSLIYNDKKTGDRTELKEISLAIKDLTIADTFKEIIKNISFTGNMDCKEARRKDLIIDSITSSIKAEKGVFHFKPLIMNLFGTKAEGDIIADKSEVDTEYKIDLNTANLDFEKLTQSFGLKKVIGGKGDLVLSLMAKEKGGRNLLNGMNGTLSLKANNLVTYTVDLDKVLSAYETSQEFTLADIGAFFIAGPLGFAALKGYRYGDAYYRTQTGRGIITQFVSHWKIENGVAEAMDCALATRHNRVALKGKLNLVSERYENVIVALLDDKGCPKFKQSIGGPFGSPQVGALNAVGSLGGQFFNLYRQAKRFAQAGKCEVFYTGSVREPR